MTDALTSTLANDHDAEPRPRIRETLWKVLELAAPNMFTCLMGLVTELINVIFLGHAGDDKVLAAIGLGNMMQNCFGLSVGFGISSALDTLVSQAFGAQQHELSCHYLQRCRILVTLPLIIIIPVLAFTEPLMDLIHQDSIVAHHAGRYNRTTAWGLFAIFQFETSMKFLMNRNQAVAPAVIGAVTSVLHVGWCALFVLKLGWGNAGAGFANVTTWCLQFLLISVYLVRYARKQGLPVREVLGLTRAAFEEWGGFMRLAVPGTIQLCSEWWFWELCAVLVGYLGSVSLAAHVATLNWVAISFMPVIGIGFSASTLVGNALGAGQPREAALTVKLCVGLNFTVWLLMAIVMVLGRQWIARAYSGDEDVVELMQKLLCIFALVGFADSSQNVMGSALRGLGKQQIAAIAYSVSYYLFMLPMACLLAFPLDLRIFGVWISMGLGTLCTLAVFGCFLARANYSLLSREALARMEREASAVPQGESGSSLPTIGAKG